MNTDNNYNTYDIDDEDLYFVKRRKPFIMPVMTSAICYKYTLELRHRESSLFIALSTTTSEIDDV